MLCYGGFILSFLHNFIGKKIIYGFFTLILLYSSNLCASAFEAHINSPIKNRNSDILFQMFFFFAECFYFSTFRSTFFEWSSAWRFYVPHHPSIWFVFMMLFSALESILLECPKLISKRSHICWHPIQQTFIIEFSCSDFHCVDLLSVRYWFVLFSLVCLLARSRHTFFFIYHSFYSISHKLIELQQFIEAKINRLPSINY